MNNGAIVVAILNFLTNYIGSEAIKLGWPGRFPVTFTSSILQSSTYLKKLGKNGLPPNLVPSLHRPFGKRSFPNYNLSRGRGNVGIEGQGTFINYVTDSSDPLSYFLRVTPFLTFGANRTDALVLPSPQ